MGVGSGLYMYDVVMSSLKKFTFAISSPDEFLVLRRQRRHFEARLPLMQTRTN